VVRALLSLVLPGVAASVAGAQQTLHWNNRVEQAVAEAKQTRKPLMFYVLSSEGDRADDMEDAQRRAFAHPRVVEVARRFIPVQMSRSAHRDQLRRWRLPEKINQEVVFATPERELIDPQSPTLAASGVADPQVFIQKMVLVFRKYRDDLYRTELRAELTAENAAAKDIRDVLKIVKEFLILSADQDVAKLLENEKLDSGLRKQVYEVLAELSTKPAVEALLARAARDKEAAAALAQCTPAAAENLLEHLGGEDFNRHLLAYKTVTKVCKVPDTKPDRFWEGKNERLKTEEINRVREAVRQTAARWRERYGDYR